MSRMIIVSFRKQFCVHKGREKMTHDSFFVYFCLCFFINNNVSEVGLDPNNILSKSKLYVMINATTYLAETIAVF